ncbi:hypothetical protein MRX96_004548 [Rhipicephalus microplus]
MKIGRKIGKIGRTQQNLVSACSRREAGSDRTVLVCLKSSGSPKLGFIDGADNSQRTQEPTWRHLCLVRSVAPVLAWTLGQEARLKREQK